MGPSKFSGSEKYRIDDQCQNIRIFRNHNCYNLQNLRNSLIFPIKKISEFSISKIIEFHE